MNIRFERADLADVDALIAVQNKSFFADFIQYGICPGYNRSHESMAYSICKRHVYKILCDDTVVGDIIVRDCGEGSYHLGCLCVIPEYENRGIGRRAMAFIDECFPDARHWSLETPSDKPRNHAFYRKHGYEVAREYVEDSVPISLLERHL